MQILHIHPRRRHFSLTHPPCPFVEAPVLCHCGVNEEERSQTKHRSSRGTQPFMVQNHAVCVRLARVQREACVLCRSVCDVVHCAAWLLSYPDPSRCVTTNQHAQFAEDHAKVSERLTLSEIVEVLEFEQVCGTERWDVCWPRGGTVL